MFIMKLKENPFELIRIGHKIFEIRLNDEKRKNISIGDTILFKKLPDLIAGVVVRVVDIFHFDSFVEMARVLDTSSMGFEKGASALDIEKYYREYYSSEEENKYGVIAFKIELV